MREFKAPSLKRAVEAAEQHEPDMKGRQAYVMRHTPQQHLTHDLRAVGVMPQVKPSKSGRNAKRRVESKDA